MSKQQCSLLLLLSSHIFPLVRRESSPPSQPHKVYLTDFFLKANCR